MLVSIVASMIVLILLTVCYFAYKQLSEIAFYEKQGIKIYPGAKRWLLGNIVEFNECTKLNMSEEEIVENPLKWLVQNIGRFVDKKDKEHYQDWMHMFILNLQGIFIVISDPDTMQGFIDDKTLIDKEKWTFTKYMMDSRVSNNLLSAHRSLDQVKRRRTMMSGFSGTNHFEILDKVVEKVLEDFLNKLEQQASTGNDSGIVVDIRYEMWIILKQISMNYLLGPDISKENVEVNKANKDGTFVKEKQPFFQAIDTCFRIGIIATANEMLFGDQSITKSQQVSRENWAAVARVFDSYVLKHIENYNREMDSNCGDKDTDELQQPTKMIDIMLDSENYQNNPQKIANDLIIVFFAGTDTSSNTTVTALSHLAKNQESRVKIRAEVDKVLTLKGQKNVMKIGLNDMKPDKFNFMHQVLNESMRFNPPMPSTEYFRVQRDCQINNINFKKGVRLMFSPWQSHQNPNQWHQPEKFLVDRFDPQSELFLTPDGKQRHQQAFIPFAIGERKCLGYMFASAVIPSIVTKLCYLYDFEFVDAELQNDKFENYPIASTLQNPNPPINMRFTPRKAA